MRTRLFNDDQLSFAQSSETMIVRETSEAATREVLGKCCELLRPIRDREGRSRFRERPLILREINNLGRRMFLVRFDDGATTFLFPYEVAIRGC